MTRFNMRYDTRQAQIQNKYLRQQSRFMQLASVELLQELQQIAEHNLAIDYEPPLALLADYAFPENAQSEESLLAQMQARLEAMEGDRRKLKLMVVLLQSLEADGFLRTPLKEILSWIKDQKALADWAATVTVNELEHALQHLQRLGPAGMAARSLQECWILQLQSIETQEPCTALALRLCQEHWDMLIKRDFESIKQVLIINQTELDQLLSYLRALRTKIEMQAQDDRMFHVVPDILLEQRDGKWHAYLNDQLIPTLNISQVTCIKADIDEAEQLLGHLAYRYKNLLALAQAMVEHQQDWLDHGEGHLKPLNLEMLAEALSLHTSTISRLCNQKYIQTPFGTYPLAEMLATAVTQPAVQSVESVATPAPAPATVSTDFVKLRLRELVTEEDTAEPYSDEQLSNLLAQEGIKISRRTVSKYRDILCIPSSYQRLN